MRQGHRPGHPAGAGQAACAAHRGQRHQHAPHGFGVKQSLQAPLEVLSAADVQADPQRIGLKGSPTQVVRTFTPEKTVECVWLEGDTAQQAGQLAKVLLEKTQRGEDAAWQA